MACAIKSGYNMHYVVTNQAGFVYDQESQGQDAIICDEIIISQESQV
jgi:hypothetical protein